MTHPSVRVTDRPWLRGRERNDLLDQIDTARTLHDVHAARAALAAWLGAHPDDLGLRDGDEELSLLEEHLVAQPAVV